MSPYSAVHSAHQIRGIREDIASGIRGGFKFGVFSLNQLVVLALLVRHVTYTGMGII